MRCFRSLLNAKSDMLDPDIPKRLQQQPIESALGTEATEDAGAVTVMKAKTNAKLVGPDDFPEHLLELGLQWNRTILIELYRLLIIIWREREVSQQWKDAFIIIPQSLENFGLTSCVSVTAANREMTQRWVAVTSMHDEGGSMPIETLVPECHIYSTLRMLEALRAWVYYTEDDSDRPPHLWTTYTHAHSG